MSQARHQGSATTFITPGGRRVASEDVAHISSLPTRRLPYALPLPDPVVSSTSSAYLDLPHVYLLRSVMRTFYGDEPKQIAIIELLVRFVVLTEPQMAELLKLNNREMGRLLGTLHQAMFIRSEQYSEERADQDHPDAKPINRTFYYIDYSLVRDVVKYKLQAMRQSMQGLVKQEQEALTQYECPRCARVYDALAVKVNVASAHLECPICEIELTDRSTSTSSDAAPSRSLYREFSEIYKTLKSLTDDPRVNAMQPLNIRAWIAQYYRKALAGEPLLITIGLPENILTSLALKQSQIVDVELGGDDDVVGQIGEATGEEETTTPEMPVWHTVSSVTGQRLIPHKEAEVESQELLQEKRSLKVGIDFPDYEAFVSKTEKASVETTEMVREIKATAILISIGNRQVPIDEITEEHKEAMTPEEYVAYYEALSKDE